MITKALRELIQMHGWMDIPPSFTCREGQLIDSSGIEWTISTPRGIVRLKFARIACDTVRWAAMRYSMHVAQSVSSVAAALFMGDMSQLFSKQEAHVLVGSISSDRIRGRLTALMESIINEARKAHKLHRTFRVIRWYCWCADRFPEAGFCEDYSNELENLVIPGGPKGEAVRTEDPEEGPLNRTLELPLLLRALQQDLSPVFEHIQQRAALALTLAFGRNPTNLVFLNETDIQDSSGGVVGIPPCYVVDIPRIKKGLIHPRAELIRESMDTDLAKHVLALIEANAGQSSWAVTEDGTLEFMDRPLFIRQALNLKPVPVSFLERAARVHAEFITGCLQAFASRLGIVSPVTGSLLKITTRRLRYTLATGLVEQGISRRALARILDHSDTQHVGVYFELKGRIVQHLDAAVAKKFGSLLSFFRGKPVESACEAENGDVDGKRLSFVNETDPEDQTEIGACGLTGLCHLDPPYSCYLCAKFQPFLNADHAHVLDCLIASRQERLKKYENARLGIQLDEVIFAVGQVVALCDGVKNDC